MNINTLTGIIKTAIADSAAITTWCTTNYSQDITIYVNLDLTDPPKESNCPYVVIYPLGKQVGEMMSPKRHNYEVIACIYDATSTTTGNVTEYAGVTNIESLRKLIETAITAADMATAWVAEIDIEYETIENFPFILAAMGIGVIESVQIGGDYLE